MPPATRLNPKDVENLINNNRGANQIRIWRQFAQELGRDPFATPGPSVTTWEEFRRKYPNPFEILTFLTIIGAVNDAQYRDVLKQADLEKEAQPFTRVSDLPQAVVQAGPTPAAPGATPRKPSAGERIMAAIDEEERRMRDLRERHLRLKRFQHKTETRPDQQVTDRELTDLKINIAKKQLERIPSRPGINIQDDYAISAVQRFEQGFVDHKVGVLQEQAGRLPSGRVTEITKDGFDTLEASDFFDKDGNFLAHKYLEAKRVNPSKVQALEIALSEEIERKETKRAITERVTDGLAIQLQQQGVRLDDLAVKNAVSNIAERVSGEVVASRREARSREGTLRETTRQANRYLNNKLQTASIPTIRYEVLNYLKPRLVGATPEELDDLTNVYTRYIYNTLISTAEAAPEAYVSTEIDSTKDFEGLGINVKLIDSKGGKVNVEITELTANQSPQAALASPDPATGALIQNAYREALIPGQKLEDMFARGEYQRWMMASNPGRTELTNRLGSDGNFRSWYAREGKMSRNRALSGHRALAEKTAELLAQEEASFRENPLGYTITLGPRLLFNAIAPKSVIDRWGATRDLAEGKPVLNRMFPYIRSGDYANSIILHWVGNATGWVDVSPTGRVSFGPFKWLNYGMRGLVSNVYGARSHLDEDSFLISLMKSKKYAGISRNRAQRMLNLSFKKKRSSIRNKHIKKYLNGERGFLGMLFGVLIGSTVSAATTWVLEKLGVMKVVREFSEGFRHVRNAWEYGGGIARPGYARRAMIEWTTGNKLRGAIMRSMSFVGRSKLFSILRGGLEGGRIFTGSVVRSVGIYGLSTLILGANPVTAALFAGGYGSYRVFDQVMKSRWFMRRFLTKWQLTGAGIGHIPAWAKSYNSWFGKFARAYNTPLLGKVGFLKNPFNPGAAFDPYGLNRVSGRMRGVSFALRNIPMNGIVFGFFFSQLGVNPVVAFGVPIGVDIGGKALRGIYNALPDTFWARILGRPGVIISAPIDILTGLYTLEETGGIFGLFQHLQLEGLTLPNLGRILGVLSPYLGIGSVLAVIVGAISLPVVVATAVLGTAIIGIDQYLQSTTGLSIWDHFWPGAKKFLSSLGLDLGKGMVGMGSAVFGIIGLIQSLLKGDVVGISIAFAMLLIGGGLLIGSNSTSVIQSSYYTPTTPVGGDAGFTQENKYILDAEKEFVGFDGNDKSKIQYSYTYEIEMSDASQLDISEIDIFELIPSGAGSSITIIPENEFYTAESEGSFVLRKDIKSSNKKTITRSFTVDLPKAVGDYIPAGGDSFCNTLIITINSMSVGGQPVTPDEPNIIREICINAEGEYVSTLTVPPIEMAAGISITSCFGLRPDPWTGRPNYHKGMDIAAPIGTPVRAAGSGIFNYHNSSEGFGKHVTIQHKDGKKTWYAHLSAPADIQDGSYVTAGQIIGYVGKSGNATGAHLHFQVDQSNSPYNPCLEKVLDICNGYYGNTCS